MLNDDMVLLHAGPEGDLKPLLEQLKAEGVFVRELDTRGLAFHSPVLQSHLPELQAGKPSHIGNEAQKSNFNALHIYGIKKTQLVDTLAPAFLEATVLLCTLLAATMKVDSDSVPFFNCSPGGGCARAQGTLSHMVVIHLRRG